MIGCQYAPQVRWAIALLIAVAVLWGSAARAANEDTPAHRAARQLMDSQQPSGQFAFEYDFLLGGPRPATKLGLGRLEYITREASAAYGLSRYYMHDPDPAVAAALVAFLGNMRELSLPIAKAPGQTALEAVGILSLPVGRYRLAAALNWLHLLYRPAGEARLVSYDRSYETAWGGATALSLLAELHFFRTSRDPQFADLRRAWLQGLLVLHNSGRGFRGLPDSIDENALSNGEVWLALASYADLFPDDTMISTVIARVDAHMIETYDARPNIGFYSWGTSAAAQRLTTTSDVKFRNFIDRQARAYIDNVGGPLTADANSCAAMEGLATALRVLSSDENQDPDFVARLRRVVGAEMNKNRSLQITNGQTRIELGNGAYLYAPSIADHAGAFLAGRHDPYVRIDYTEHCIVALLASDEGKP